MRALAGVGAILIFGVACDGGAAVVIDAAADAPSVDATVPPDAQIDADLPPGTDASPSDAPPPDAAKCGNGVIDEGEECEAFDLGGRTCMDFGFDYGTLVCTACEIDTTFCVQLEICDNGIDDDGDATVDCEDASCADDPICPRCGNGVADPGEECDHPDLRGYTCGAFGFVGGVLACAACMFDTSGCADETCTNGIDDDGDGLFDCGDPDCDPYPDCGIEPTGYPCAVDSDCDGGVCLDDATDGWPSGYCTELCDLALGLCGADADAACIDDGTGDGLGLCLAVCMVGGTDCRTAYVCQDTMMGYGVCVPL